ncbi:MAG: tyrosine-type recombinase/integrase [Chloroflexota bacterium]
MGQGESSTTSADPLRDRAIVLVLVDTGIRAGELVGLKMKDLSLREGEIRAFGKDQEERLVPIGRQAIKALTRYLESRHDHGNNRPVFISKHTDEALTVHGLRQILKRLARRAGLEERIYTHLFRHTFSQRWMTDGTDGGDLESLRLALGHNQLSTTRIYAGLQIEEVKRKHQKLSPANRLLQAEQLRLW